MFVIKIEDTGKGFSKEEIERVFDPFFTTKEKGKGTGLGMWIVKRLLERAKGNIEIKNTGNGALVILTIPKKKGE